MADDWWWAPIPWAILLAGTGAVVVAFRRGNLETAVGLVFVLASISRFGVPILGSTLRFEQPAVLILVTLLLTRDARTVAEFVRRSGLAVGFAVVYVSAHVVASAISPPEKLESLKIAAWLAVSMAGGLVVAVLAYRTSGRLQLARWIVGVGLLHTAVAAVAIASQVLLKTDWGVQDHDVLIGKAYGLVYEANLFGILIATALPFAILGVEDGGIDVRGRARLAMVTALAMGLGMSYSRGALLAFAVAATGLALAALLRRPTTVRRAARLAAAGVCVLAIAIGTIQVQDALARVGSRDTTCLIVLEGLPAPSPTPMRSCDTVEPEIVGTGDTIAVRLRSLTRALAAFPERPLIGHGTDSFGYTHTEISCRCPAHISNIAVASLYEVGLIGSLALVGFLLAVARAIWRLGALALGAGIVAMLVGYLVTDALRFETTWILLGLPLGAAAALPYLRPKPPAAARDQAGR